MSYSIQQILASEKFNELLSKHGTATAIQSDPDIVGATVGQAMLLLNGIPNRADTVVDETYLATNAVAIKLGALRYHYNRFVEIQRKRIDEINADQRIVEAIRKGAKICEREILYEFEGFFHQFKSSLDMLVKIFGPLFGGGSLSRYGNKGTEVASYLKKQKERNSKLTPGRIDWLIELIEQARDPWLKSAIAIRDTVSHYRPYIHFGFGWDPTAYRVVVPMNSTEGVDRPLFLALKQQIDHLIGFTTEFIARAVSCAIPLDLHVQVMDEMEKRYIGARWGINLSRVTWKLHSDVLIDYSEKDIADATEQYKREIGAK